MIENTGRKAAIVFIILGVIGISLITLFGYGTITYLTKYRLEGGLWVYKYNFSDYIQNITQTIGNTTPLQLTMPTRTWGDGIEWLSNNLALIMDWLIFILNVILYPLRVGAYLVLNTLSIIGIDMREGMQPNTGIKWLIDLVQSIVGWQIPYI